MRRLFLTGLWLCLAMWHLGAYAQNPSNQVQTEQVQATLLAHAPEGLAPGKTLWLGLQLNHAPHWHTYWKNPGDSGLPTTLTWDLPAGVTAGDVLWPTPRKFPLGDLANYGYDEQVLLPVPVQLDASYRGGDLHVQLQASWLVCRTECIPEEGRFNLTIPAGSPPIQHAQLFERAQAQAPTPAGATAVAQITPGTDHLVLTVSGLPGRWHGKTLEVFPETPNLVAPGAPWTQAWSGDRWTAQLPYSDMRHAGPSRVAMVLATDEDRGLALEATVTGAWPSTAAPAPVPDALAKALAAPAPAPVPVPGLWTWLLAMGGALLGGLVLNLMPCVFPVLAIKVLAFAQHTGSVREHRVHGLAYTLGVVLSFLALGAVLLGLRAAGEQLGWGFQLQSPAVVTGLAVLFTLTGLNLAGLFAVGQVLPQALVNLRAQDARVDAFLTGVLATAVASPCTAPFMGASLGLAITLPPVQALGVFAALGLGMALPYLAASWVPAVARLMPRPGAWMETFKQWLAFPMLATVVWLLWVLGQQTGIDGAALLLLWLVLLGWLLWSLGLHGRVRTVMVSVAGAVLVAMAALWGPQALTLHADTPAPTTGHPTWAAWAPEKQADALAQGRIVFVDYTAAWCLTCQYNKRTTLADAGLLADLAQKNVVLMRADWTRRDPTVTTALQALGRNGVPVYAFYKNGVTPVVLSEVLSLEDVRNALAGL